MSVEDGLMQPHPARYAITTVKHRFDPIAAETSPSPEFTRNLRPLLNASGNDPR